MAKYTNASPWVQTSQNKLYLEIWEPIPIPAESDDYEYVIQASYNYRPDLLAYDLYGNPKLWWVFAQRNPAILKDPVYDLVAGKKIYLPKLSSMRSRLGI